MKVVPTWKKFEKRCSNLYPSSNMGTGTFASPCTCTVHPNVSTNVTGSVNVKVKQSHYRPEHALRIPGGWGSQISWQPMKVISFSAPRTGRLYTPGNIPGTHLCERLFQTQGHSAAGSMWKKIPATPSKIEPATFGLVAPCLNQLRHRVPPKWQKVLL